MLVRKKLDMQLREILLRERSGRYGKNGVINLRLQSVRASLEGSKRAKLRTIPYLSTLCIYFFQKGGLLLSSENKVKKLIVKGLRGREESTIRYNPVSRFFSFEY